jgi:hypothetical protein
VLVLVVLVVVLVVVVVLVLLVVLLVRFASPSVVALLPLVLGTQPQPGGQSAEGPQSG